MNPFTARLLLLTMLLFSRDVAQRQQDLVWNHPACQFCGQHHVPHSTVKPPMRAEEMP